MRPVRIRFIRSRGRTFPNITSRSKVRSIVPKPFDMSISMSPAALSFLMFCWVVLSMPNDDLLCLYVVCDAHAIILVTGVNLRLMDVALIL